MSTLSRVRLLHVLALLAGTVGFALLVDRIGWDAMQGAIVGAGWWFLWIALIDLVSVSSDAAAVYSFVRAEAPVSYLRVFAAQASGMSINRLTPGNSMGEAIKVTMLVDHVPKTTAVSAIVKFNLATLYVALTVVVLGVPLTLVGLDLPARVELAVWIGTAVVVIAAVLLALLLRRGAIATCVRLMRSLGAISQARATRWIERIASIDASIKSFNNPWSRRGVMFVACSRVLHFAATIAVLRAAAVPMTPPVVIGMLSVGILVTWMSNIVPLGIGLADGTNYILYSALGASPIAGLAFTMVNRTRTCVLAAMGLTVMLLANLVDRTSRSVENARAARESRTAFSASDVRRDADALSDARTT